jgi:hypothetical protein
MKRILGAIAAGAVAFSGIYALAASLNVSSNTLGAGTSVVASCQSATLTATYTPEAWSTSGGYTVSTVTVTGLASSCYTLPYRVTLYSGSSSPYTSLGEATGTTPGSGNSFAASFSALSANAVTGVAVVIGG